MSGINGINSQYYQQYPNAQNKDNGNSGNTGAVNGNADPKATQGPPPSKPAGGSASTDTDSTVTNIQSLISRLPSNLQGQYSTSLSSIQSSSKGSGLTSALSSLQSLIEGELSRSSGAGSAGNQNGAKMNLFA